MNGRKLFELISQGGTPNRIPFVPTIYEHGAKVIGETPSRVAQNEDLIVKSQLASYEMYRHDLISIGVDIYNIECEALGAEVSFSDNEDLPSINETLVKNIEDLAHLKMPDPERSGRMPIFLNAAERINKELGQEVIVNGTVVGPFTLAAILRGFENFIMDIMFDTKFALQLMDFSKKVGLAFAKHFIKRGVGLSINESWISPPLLSPDLYKKYVFQIEKEMVEEIKCMGQKNVALISGGNTTLIAPYMVKTGTSLLMADYNTDQEYYKKLCAENQIIIRASIDSKVVEFGTAEEMSEAAKRVIDTCADYGRFVFGCGVVSYTTPIEQVLQLKRIVNELNPYE